MSKAVETMNIKFRWIVVAILFLVGLTSTMHLLPLADSLRLALGVSGLLLGLAVAWFTPQAHQFQQFWKDAREELGKVTWPTPRETWQTALAVVLMVSVVGLVLFFLDTVLLWLVSGLTQ